jgi:hypothetical protein
MRLKFDVSITSHPARFPALSHVLRSLKDQTLYPDRIFVFLSASDLKQFEFSAVSNIKNLSLFSCKDLGPGTKLLPRLAMGHDRPIIVIDDDLQYDSNLFQGLVEAHIASPELIVGSRAHRVVRTDSNEVADYLSWDREVEDIKPAWNIFTTSGHGTLYPPGCFAPSILDVSRFMRLSFHTDDLWYFFHARIAGTEASKLPGVRALLPLENTQQVALWRENVPYRNNLNLKLLIENYGDPERPRRINHMERVGLFAQRALLLRQVRELNLHPIS